MTEHEPELEVLAVTSDVPSVTVAHAGPTESWDFDPLVQEVLATLAQGSARPRGRVGLRVICRARYTDAAPGFRLTRLLIGQLLALDSSIELHLEQRQDDVHPRWDEDGGLPRLRVEFSLETHSDHDLQEISHAIGLQPSRQIRKGEVQELGGLRSASTRWVLALPERPAATFDVALDHLLAQLEPRAASISSLTRHELDGVLSLIGYFSASAPLLRLRVDQLRIVRELGLEVDVDLMPVSPELSGQ